MANLLKVENLCFAYLKKPLCLKDVSFNAARKDKVLVLGLDDRGKSTLLKTLSGFEDKFFGKVFLDGKELRSLLDSEKQVSLIFDYPVLLSGSIDKNLNFLYETLKKEIPTHAEKIDLLKRFNLNCDLSFNIKKLSLFEKFKLCFLRSYIKNSRVLFIDDLLKNKFNKDEISELKEIIMELSKERLLFFAANEKTFNENFDFFEYFEWSKILYLNNAKLIEKNNLNDFFGDPYDLDACLFDNKLSYHEGYCIYQDGGFYLNIEEKFIIKIDKRFDKKFESLNLADLENEDIVVVYNSEIDVDFNKNNDFNKLLMENKLMVFSKLDRSRII